MILEEDNSLRLSEKDKETLKQWGETDEDIQQIERALNVTEFTVGDVERAENGSIVIPDEDNDRVITAQEAREILGDETFLSGLDRSAFHWTSGRYNADETKYVSFDSSKLFKDSELCEESKERFNCPECNEDINELFECDGKCECPECGHSGNKEDFRECINKKLKKENKKAIVEGKLNFIENVDELPDMCYGVLPSDNSIIIIKKGETGYYTTDYNDMVEGETYDERYHSANEVANNLNAEIDITPDQRFTMEIRSMNGNWSTTNKKEERNLTRAERHNRDAERIYDTYNKQIERFCEFLRRLGYDEDRITKVRQNTGIGAHELWDLAQSEAEKLGPDVWDKVCNLSVDMDEIVPAK